MNTDEPTAVTRPAVLLLALISAALTSSLEASMIYSALPTIIRETADPTRSGWLVSGFLLVYSGSAALGGRIGDLYGRSQMLLAILSVCLVGSLISAFSANLSWVVVGRAVQGLSGAILPLCYGLCAQFLPGKKMPVGASIVSAVYGLGGIFGYLSGAAFSEYGKWQQIFLATSILTAISIALVAIIVPKSTRRNGSRDLDILGGLLFVPALCLILVGATEAPKWALGFRPVLILVGAGILLALYWMRYEWRHPNPLIDVRLMRVSEIRTANVLFALAGLGALQLTLIILMLLQQQPATGAGFGRSAVLSAALKLPGSIMTALGSLLSGWIASHREPRLGAVIAGAVQVGAWILLCFSISYLPGVVLGLTMSSLASGMLLGTVPILVLQSAPRARSSEATGMAAAVMGMALAVGSQVILALLAASPAVHAPAVRMPSEYSYRLAMLFVTFTSFCGFLAALSIPRRRAKRRSASLAAAERATY